MKKLFSSILIMVLAFSIFLPTALHADQISVTIDGVTVDFDGQPPTIVDNRTLVPVRGVFEALGFDVDWDVESRAAILINDDFEVIIAIDSNVFTVNGVSHTLDVPAQIIEDRTMLPIRAVLENVGLYVDWDGGTNTVLVSTIPFMTYVPTPTPSPTPQPTPTPAPYQTNLWDPTDIERTAWTANRTSEVIHRTSTCSNMGNPVETTIGDALARPNGGRPCQRCWAN